MGDAESLSPMNPINFKKIYANARQTTRFVIMVAENDSPAFHDQSIRFYEMLKATGVNAHFTEIKDTDHFGEYVVLSIDFEYIMNVTATFPPARQPWRYFTSGSRPTLIPIQALLVSKKTPIKSYSKRIESLLEPSYTLPEV